MRAADVTSSVYGTPCDGPRAQAYLLEPGENKVTVTVEDLAGHRTTGTHAFTVTATYDGLKSMTNAFLRETGDHAWEAVAKSYNKSWSRQRKG